MRGEGIHVMRVHSSLEIRRPQQQVRHTRSHQMQIESDDQDSQVASILVVQIND